MTTVVGLHNVAFHSAGIAREAAGLTSPRIGLNQSFSHGSTIEDGLIPVRKAFVTDVTLSMLLLGPNSA
jgi:hypothetical protein